MITFGEQCLSLTQEDGLKKYAETVSGPVHVLKVDKIVDNRTLNIESFPSYVQDIFPYSHVKGRKVESITIDGPLCEANAKAVADFLEEYIPYRRLNTLYNVFLPCSILTCSDPGDHPEIGDGTKWMVQSFTVSRSVSRRSIILYTLKLIKYYTEV